MKNMTQKQMREIALGSARSICRARGVDIKLVGQIDALRILDDLARSEPDKIASIWYMNASGYQIDAFQKEWNAWKKKYT